MNFTLCLTHDCNLRCTYCYAGRKFAKAMSWQVAKQSVDFCLFHTLKTSSLSVHEPNTQIGYFGGEPLLEWELLRRSAEYAFSEAEKMGIKLRRTVTTNMVLLDEYKCNWLRDNKFYIGLSLDGNESMHNSLRRFPDCKGSHAESAAALRFFRGADVNGEVIVVVDPRNVIHLADSLEWLVSQEIRNISLNPNFHIRWSKESLEIWEEAYEQAGNLFISCYRKNSPLRLNFIDSKIQTHLKGGYSPCDKCGFGENEIAIAPSGNIYPCERVVSDDKDDKLRIGDVFRGFDLERRSKIISSCGNTNPECTTCAVKGRCMNWCSCINYATTGALNQVSGILCFHERMAINVADRVGATLFAESNSVFLSKYYPYPTN